jgi:RNA polymerase sigma-70 factor, ECF subfamily
MIAEAVAPERETNTPFSFESLRAQYLDAVYAYAKRRLSREDAEDATAETFQAAIDNLHRLKGQDPRLWLLGIARRKVSDVLRRRSRRREVPLEEELPAAGGKSVVQAEADGKLRQIVAGLPKAQREALMLQHLEGLSIAEIATVMGKRPAAANSLLQRARAQIFRQGRSYFLDTEVTK